MKPLPKLSRPAAFTLAQEIVSGDYSTLISIANNPAMGGWQKAAIKLLAFILNPTIKTPYRIFAKGNGKLPFSAFSALPVITCPGAGDCIKFCYSFKCWQYPAALFRQIQNTWLLRYQKDIITSAFSLLPSGVFRLYVDGDFSSKEDVRFWMGLLSIRPDIQGYGYSKSWVILLAAKLSGVIFPDNYLLNLSSGGNAPHLLPIMKSLPFVRGEFVAVPVAKEHIKSRAYQGPSKSGFGAYQKDTLASAKDMGYDRGFVCKGKCGACLPNGMHACGSSKFRNVPILIGVH